MNFPHLSIEIDEIKYGTNHIVLKNSQLSIQQFGIFGVFGKNGQGKSTFLKTLAGLKTYKGKITLNNTKLEPHQIAYIGTEPNVYEYLTAKEFYTFYQKVSGRKSTNQTNKIFDIDEDVILKSMSTGTLKKAYINAILQFSDYDIYIFDEPFNGLDIESNYVLIEKLKELSQSKIVFISSHILEVIQPFLDGIFFVNDKLIKEIKINELIKNLQNK